MLVDLEMLVEIRFAGIQNKCLRFWRNVFFSEFLAFIYVHFFSKYHPEFFVNSNK